MISKYFVSILIGLTFFQSENWTYLTKDQYSYELDYQFETKPTLSSNEVDLSGRVGRHSRAPLPYVKVNVKLFELDSELIKYRVVNNQGEVMGSKKIKSLPVNITIDMGFGEDIKDRTGPYIFTLNLLDGDKRVKKKLIFEFEENGNMMVNGELSGKI